MVVEAIVVFLLLSFIFVREWQHSRTEGELINKLMSRNYHEYQVSQAVTQVKETQGPMYDPDLQPIADPLIQQQLGVMTGLN